MTDEPPGFLADPQRLRLMENLGLNRPDAEFDAFAQDLAERWNLPYAMVNVMLPDQQVFVGLHTPPEDSDLPTVGRTMPTDHGYCPDVVKRGRALVLPDVYVAPRFAGNEVVDAIGIRTYAGAPLIHSTGTVLGTICVVGTNDLPDETGRASLDLIKDRAAALTELLEKRTGQSSPMNKG